MIAEGIATAMIAACSALGGAAIAHWGAARIQSRQDSQALAREHQALLRQQRADCLNWVLEARARIEALLLRLTGQTVAPVPAGQTAGAAARQAYAVALLYLADARPWAKAFYRTTTALQLALDTPIAGASEEFAGLVSSWRTDYEAFEGCLAEMSDRVWAAQREARE